MLVDTHCHLHDREFFDEKQAKTLLKRAQERGVGKIICIGTSLEDSRAAQAFAKEKTGVFWTFGIHPENAGDWERNQLDELEFFADPSLKAIGEVGLDYHREGYDRQGQIQLFNEMLQLAQDHNLPLSFHVREAFDDFFAVTANFPKVHGVVHSFTDNKRNLKKIIEQTEFLVGVNGLATYSTLPLPPLERIALETDAPFLTPTPFRGMINEPGYIREIAQWLSEKLAVKFEVIEKETTQNARQLFGI